jgi:hypothetical protein
MTLPATSGGGGQTVGTLMPHTGGVEELRLRQEVERKRLENELLQQHVAGTGVYAKRAQPYKRGVITSGGTGGKWEGQGDQYGDQTDQDQELPFGEEPVGSNEDLNKRSDQISGQKNSVGIISNGTATQDKSGNYVVTLGDKQYNFNKDAYEAIRNQINVRNKRERVGLLPRSEQVTDPTLGTTSNPVHLKTGSNLEINSWPSGTIAIMPDGRPIKVK